MLQNPYADPTIIQGHVFQLGPGVYTTLFNVVEGNDTRPEVQYNLGPLAQYATYKNASGSSILGYGPWLTDAPFIDKMIPSGGAPSGDEIYSMDVSPGETVDYYINVKNGVGQGYELYDRFALLQLLDYEQVPIRTDVPAAYVYNGTLDPGTFFAMPVSVKAPMTPGDHMLSVAMVTYPFENNLAGNNNDTFTFLLIDSVVLNVKE